MVKIILKANIGLQKRITLATFIKTFECIITETILFSNISGFHYKVVLKSSLIGSPSLTLNINQMGGHTCGTKEVAAAS